jgi:hypothetical protein
MINSGIKKISFSSKGIIVTFILSLFLGTIIWLIWPIAIPSTFPGLITSGIITAKLSWWQSICLTWIFNILIKK